MREKEFAFENISVYVRMFVCSMLAAKQLWEVRLDKFNG